VAASAVHNDAGGQERRAVRVLIRSNQMLAGPTWPRPDGREIVLYDGRLEGNGLFRKRVA
jgi:hypothetical protein